jgi:hypothetical protein
MSTYKVKLTANVERFFSTKRVKGIEIVEANSYEQAKEKATQIIKRGRRNLAIENLMDIDDVPDIEITDIEKVE